MKNSIIEVIKVNKKAIMKKALIIGGTVIGLAVVGKLIQPSGDDEVVEVDEIVVDAEEVEGSDEEN